MFNRCYGEPIQNFSFGWIVCWVVNAKVIGIGSIVGLSLATATGLMAGQDESRVLDAASLKSMIVGLGYEVKDIGTEVGKEKYEFTVKTTGFNVPMGAEISPSKNYIWLTASLGQVKETTKFRELLRANGVVQPTQFYITSKDNLMIALAIENHGVTPVWMRKGIDKVAKDVGDQASAWNSTE